jgi:hypothetical protein
MKRRLTAGLICLATLALGASPTIAQPPPVPGAPPPVPVLPVPAPAGPAVVVERPLTIYEFARVVKPIPGRHEVLLCHPYTGQPVRVCFTLPAGCPKVTVRKKLLRYQIEFDYGCREVELNFGCRGRTRVHY